MRKLLILACILAPLAAHAQTTSPQVDPASVQQALWNELIEANRKAVLSEARVADLEKQIAAMNARKAAPAAVPAGSTPPKIN